MVFTIERCAAYFGHVRTRFPKRTRVEATADYQDFMSGVETLYGTVIGYTVIGREGYDLPAQYTHMELYVIQWDGFPKPQLVTPEEIIAKGDPKCENLLTAIGTVLPKGTKV
jgi:hypothetical protein